MKYLFITILLCFSIIITRAQKINPYLLTDRQADSLHAALTQTSNDSLKMELVAIFGLYHTENNRDSAIYFLNRQLALATRLNLPLWKAEALSSLCYLYSAIRDYPKALQAHYEALQITSDKASDKNKYSPKFIVGIPAWFTSRESLLGVIHFTTALLHTVTKDYGKAAASYTESIRLAEKIGDRDGLPTYYRSLATNCRVRDKQDSALMLIQKALALSRATRWQHYTGQIYQALGEMCHARGDDTTALRYLRLSASTSRERNYFSGEGAAYNSICGFFLDKNQPDSAIVYGKTAQGLFGQVKNEAGMASTYDRLFAAFQMKGNKDSAFAYLLLSKQLRDNLNDADRTQAGKYQAMNFNEQLRRQDADNERSRRQSRLIIYAALAGLAVTFLILFLLYRNNRQKQKTNTALAAISDLQDKKITQLDEAVTKRTEQLNTFRQAMATDFHDQTGNMLSAITRQASLLKLKLTGQKEVLPMVDSIITNSNELYDSSKDFLWNLNHNSDDPLEVFQYLTGYGQVFYNQFRIPFSSTVKGEGQSGQQLEPFAALNLIYIFKEAMTNVVRHAEADEVIFEMENTAGKVMYSLHDDGRWKPKDETTSHYGLRNIERRCERNNFGFLLSRQDEGTKIEITAPVKIDFI